MLLPLTPRFRAALNLANRVPPERFSALLARIMKQLIQDKIPFTEEEELKLVKVLNFEIQDLRSLIDACSLTFERAAAMSAPMPQIIELLDSAGVSPSQIQLAGFQDVWKENSSGLINACKEKPFGAPGNSYLLDTQWRLHLRVASTEAKYLCEPVGILQLKLSYAPKFLEDHPSSMVLSFSKDELLDFYEKLEKIQEQIDSFC